MAPKLVGWLELPGDFSFFLISKFRSYPRPIKSISGRWDTDFMFFWSPPKWFQCTDKFGNHWIRVYPYSGILFSCWSRYLQHILSEQNKQNSVYKRLLLVWKGRNKNICICHILKAKYGKEDFVLYLLYIYIFFSFLSYIVITYTKNFSFYYWKYQVCQ